MLGDGDDDDEDGGDGGGGDDDGGGEGGVGVAGPLACAVVVVVSAMGSVGEETVRSLAVAMAPVQIEVWAGYEVLRSPLQLRHQLEMG